MISGRYEAEISYILGAYMIDVTDSLDGHDDVARDMALAAVDIVKAVLRNRALIEREIAYVAKYTSLAVGHPDSLAPATIRSAVDNWQRYDTTARTLREVLDLTILPLQRKVVRDDA